MPHTEHLCAIENMREDVMVSLDILILGKDVVPSHLYQKCSGVLLLSTRNKGVIVNRTIGKGLLLSHNPETNKWSYPLSVTCHGMGVGLSVGSEDTSMIVIIQSPDVVSKFAKEGHFPLETHVWSHHSGDQEKEEHHKKTIAYTFATGQHYGVAVEGCVIKLNHHQHQEFYGKEVTPSQVVDTMNGTDCHLHGGSKLVKMLHEELSLLASQSNEEAGA
jgi:lipid-binding SYLF domain-containing protein